MAKLRRNPIALAREWEALLANGTFASRADLARELGVSRARVTQILNLLNLTPLVLEAVAVLGDQLPSGLVSEHRLRPLTSLPRQEQIRALETFQPRSLRGRRSLFSS